MTFIRKHYHHAALLAFLCLHAAVLAFVGYYGDDFYYASFVRGDVDRFLTENIAHYLTVNGRALVHILDELLIGFSLIPWKIVCTLSVGGLIVVSAKLAAKCYRRDCDREAYKRMLVIAVCLFAATDITMLRESIFWATGMMNYALPAFLTLGLYYLLRRDYEYERGSLWLILPAFFASMTTEQASVGAFLTILCFIVTSCIHRRKSPPKAYFAALIASALGLMTLFCAPGNIIRKAFYPEFYAENPVSRVIGNIPTLYGAIFSRLGIYPIVFATLAVILVYSLTHRKSKLARVCAIASGIALIAYFASIVLFYDSFTKNYLLVVLLFPAMLIPPIFTAVRYFTRGEIDELYLVWLAYSMQAVMLLSPLYGPRTVFISLAAMLPVLARRLDECRSVALYAVLGLFALTIFPKTFSPWWIFAAVYVGFALVGLVLLQKRTKQGVVSVLVAALMLTRYSVNVDGYRENYAALLENRARLASYADTDRTEPLKLVRLPNDDYRYTYAYDDYYHEVKLLELYGIYAIVEYENAPPTD